MLSEEERDITNEGLELFLDTGDESILDDLIELGYISEETKQCVIEELEANYNLSFRGFLKKIRNIFTI